jgi:hypothetical protein
MSLANIALVKRDGTDFSDLDADLDAERTVEQVQADSKAVSAFYAPAAKPAGEICPKCKGCGRYRVGNHQYGTYRDLGPCFKCGGTGAVSAAVAKAHRTRETNKAAKVSEQNAWLKEHGDVMRWIGDELPYSNFAQSLNTHFDKTGRLSTGQIIAVRKILAEKVTRAQLASKTAAETASQGNGLDLRHIPDGRYAVPNGDTRLKVRIEKPEAPTKWAGWVFVSDGADYGQRRRYGRQAPGKTYDGMIEDELRIIAADPKAAAIAYGKLTGTCCLCGRKLENENSVAAGIGPICAQKEGW